MTPSLLSAVLRMRFRRSGSDSAARHAASEVAGADALVALLALTEPQRWVR
ncbi:hypothetical protein ACGF1Z_26700 [Streptomyces sp. NPDC048018]|uniref:hypothetical protein n=1 Tax=Streptomyces sp. NPDC048018 TaxID=3365499 RepID=UPI00372144BB